MGVLQMLTMTLKLLRLPTFNSTLLAAHLQILNSIHGQVWREIWLAEEA